jgi:hypothetical protein
VPGFVPGWVLQAGYKGKNFLLLLRRQFAEHFEHLLFDCHASVVTILTDYTVHDKHKLKPRDERSEMDNLHSALTSALADRYAANAARVRELAAPFSNTQFWQKPFAFGNSFGHLILHLTGNLNYYIGAQIAKTGYVRDRPREFNDPNPPPKDEALKRFGDAVEMVLKTIHAQTPEDWSGQYSGVGADAKNRLAMVLICAAHMQHHIGQMIYLTYEWERRSK